MAFFGCSFHFPLITCYYVYSYKYNLMKEREIWSSNGGKKNVKYDQSGRKWFEIQLP